MLRSKILYQAFVPIAESDYKKLREQRREASNFSYSERGPLFAEGEKIVRASDKRRQWHKG